MQPVLNLLALVGRYGTQGFAASLFVGLALPGLAASARPFLGVTIFVFLLTTFLRVQLPALVQVVVRPGRLLAACLCVLLTPPLIVWAVLAVVGRDVLDPGVVLGLAILAASPPIMSSPAVALLLGVEPALIIATVLSITAVSPILSPLIANLVAGAAIPLDPTVLVLRLVGLVGGAAFIGIVLRRLLGMERIQRRRASLDGIGVLMYLVFAVAAMDGVLAAILREPVRMASFLGIAVALAAAGFAVAWLVLRPVAPPERLVLGYATGQRNMGLLVAALGAGTPETTFLFFAVAQFPIYLAPQIMRLLAVRLAVRPPG